MFEDKLNRPHQLEWLADLHKSQCFTTSATTNPAISSDLGVDGFTASLTSHGMLLQITAPDPHCGLVFVRGRFANNAGSILARAQGSIYRQSKDLFGARLASAKLDEDVQYGEKKAQGWVNFRWPYVQYELRKKNPSLDRTIGLYEQITFIRNGVIFQAIRLKWGRENSISDNGDDGEDTSNMITINLQTGGRVRFGCPCSATQPHTADSFEIKVGHTQSKTLRCESSKYEKQLETQLFVNGILDDFAGQRPRTIETVEAADITTIHSVEVSIGQPTYIVSALALRNKGDDCLSTLDVAFSDIEDYLGVCSGSIRMTDRLWTGLCSPNYEDGEAVELCAVGRCVEQILGVAALPHYMDSSRAYGGREHMQGTQMTSGVYRGSGIALVQTIMTPQFVDVQSAFFQIRFLVKAHNFISTRYLGKDLLETEMPIHEIKEYYLNKIRYVLGGAIHWLVNTDFKSSRLLLGISAKENDESKSIPPPRLTECEHDRADASFDRDYNRSCYATIAVCQALAVSPNGLPVDPFGMAGVKREDLLHTQQRFQKYASRLKGNKGKYYSPRHEELDRIVLLGEELDLQSIGDNIAAAAAIAQIKSRADQTRARLEARTRTGRFNQGPTARNARYEPLNSPWELLCTNHELYLRTAPKSSTESARNRVFQFMTSDYSFMASWDRSDGDMVAKWWDFEPSAIVCATILDLKTEGKLPSADMIVKRHENRMMPVEIITENTMKFFRNTNDLEMPFDWTIFKPRNEFHSHWWTHSLDDTPEVYEVKQTKNVDEQKNIIHYLQDRDRDNTIIEDSVYSEMNINTKIKPKDLLALSCFDLCHTDQADLLLRDITSLANPSNPQVEAHYQTMILKLRDSLVDLDVKHRILKVTPALVGATLYLWHPQALSAFDDYFGPNSRFMDSREGMSWTTSINISHWLISEGSIDSIWENSFHEGRNYGNFPPDTIPVIAELQKECILEERSSLLVFTGDSLGHLWICSMWSSLVEPDALRAVVAGDIRRVQQIFIHQQSTGRCLVFLILLGHICENLAVEYERILKRLGLVVGLGEEVLLRGIDWASTQTLERLKKMLWGLEALRAFDERLSASIHQIERATEALGRSAAKESSNQVTDLLHEYQQTLDEFTRRFDMLSDVDLRTKLKIKQVISLRDGISTVTNVADSRAALETARITVNQGKNIRTLTYITVAYLPVGFVTGLFSVSHAPFMDSAGNLAFALLMTITILVTYMIALFLQNVIDQWPNVSWQKRKPSNGVGFVGV
ncbi:hypothetical protein TruAng_000195 [Truncatella angustata]|nr:hypothetical protein TruAng_000195 [Truncatella angustata]